MVDDVKVLAAKKEGVYGTDAAPTLAANAILTRNFRTKPLQVDQIERNLDNAGYGATKSAPSNKRQTVSFEVELAGSGAAGTAPRFMELHEACGMAAPVISAGVSAEQKPGLPTVAASSLTLHHWKSDQRRRAVGARGTFSLDFTAGRYPFSALNLTALLAAVPFDKSAPAAADFSDFIEPLEVNTTNTDFLLDGYAAILKSWRMDMNVNINVRNLVGANYVNRGNHSARCRIEIEAPDIATKNYLASLDSGDVIEQELDHGTVAGNILEIRTPQLQIVDIDEGEEDDKVMWTIDAIATVIAGADDFSITAK